MKLTDQVDSIDKRSALIGAGATVAGYYLYKKFFKKDEECEDDGSCEDSDGSESE